MITGWFKAKRTLIRDLNAANIELGIANRIVNGARDTIIDLQGKYVLERQVREMFRDALSLLIPPIKIDGVFCFCGFVEGKHTVGCKLARAAYERMPRE